MSIEHEMNSPLAEAVKAAGSQSEFGRIIGKRQSTVRDWLAADKPLPAELVLLVERQLGVSRHKLRPDIYPVEYVATPTHEQSGIAANGIPVKPNVEAIAA